MTAEGDQLANRFSEMMEKIGGLLEKEKIDVRIMPGVKLPASDLFDLLVTQFDGLLDASRKDPTQFKKFLLTAYNGLEYVLGYSENMEDGGS